MGIHKHKTEGSITVFLSLVLLLILSLIFTIIEGARVSVARVTAERALTTAMDSVLAEYYGPLWEEYHIFAFNTGGDSNSENENRMKAKISEFMSYTFTPEKELDHLDYSEHMEFNEISVDQISINNQTMLMDYQGQLMMNEAVEYMKYEEIAGGIELLLNKLSLLKTPEKVSYLQEEKQKVEQELVEIDKGILELMELFDGIQTGKNGIELSRDGQLKISATYIKKICYEDITMDTVGINHQDILLAQMDSYVDPTIYFNSLNKDFDNLDQIFNQRRMILGELEKTSTSLTLEEKKLVVLEASQDKSDEDKQQIKTIKANIKDLEVTIKEHEKAIEEQDVEIISLVSSVHITNNILLQLISEIKPLINAAISSINKIIIKTEIAKPLLENYEKLLNQEREAIDDDIYTGLEDELNELKRYITNEKNSYNFTEMLAILEQDMDILIRTETALNLAEEELDQEDYISSKIGFSNAQGILSDYQIKGLTLDYSTLVLERSGQADLLGEISNLLQVGLASLVIDPNSISDKKLSEKTLPSDIATLSNEDTDFLSKLTSFFESTAIGGGNTGMGELFGGFGDGMQMMALVEKGVNKAAEIFLFQEYLGEHFGMNPKEGENIAERKPSVLTYEQEYLLVGKTSDQENIGSVISRIIFFRTICDFVSILGDRAKCNEAKLAASALVGFTGLPILVSITKVLILLIWSFAEALLDTCALMQGKDVPILKKSVVLEFPELFMINRAYLQSKVSQVVNTKELTFSYPDYLKVFLLMKNKEDTAYRSMDLMQENIVLRYNENTFSICNCLFGYEVSADFSIAAKFTALTFIRNYIGSIQDGFRYSTKAAYSY